MFVSVTVQISSKVAVKPWSNLCLQYMCSAAHWQQIKRPKVKDILYCSLVFTGNIVIIMITMKFSSMCYCTFNLWWMLVNLGWRTHFHFSVHFFFPFPSLTLSGATLWKTLYRPVQNTTRPGVCRWEMCWSMLYPIFHWTASNSRSIRRKRGSIYAN